MGDDLEDDEWVEQQMTLLGHVRADGPSQK
jgi:hypothetical protein